MNEQRTSVSRAVLRVIRILAIAVIRVAAKESSPFLLSQPTERDLLEASDAELARAIWFWGRRPKLIFNDGAAPIIVALCVVISLSIALVNWRGTSMSSG